MNAMIPCDINLPPFVHSIQDHIQDLVLKIQQNGHFFSLINTHSNSTFLFTFDVQYKYIILTVQCKHKFVCDKTTFLLDSHSPYNGMLHYVSSLMTYITSKQEMKT